MSFESVGDIFQRVLAKARDEMELHKERADLVAERLGSDDFDRRDGRIYEHHAINAQKAADRVAGLEKTAAEIAEGRWSKLTPDDFTW